MKVASGGPIGPDWPSLRSHKGQLVRAVDCQLIRLSLVGSAKRRAVNHSVVMAVKE